MTDEKKKYKTPVLDYKGKDPLDASDHAQLEGIKRAEKNKAAEKATPPPTKKS